MTFQEPTPSKLEQEADKLLQHRRGDGKPRRAATLAAVGASYAFSLGSLPENDAFQPQDTASTALEVYTFDLYKRARLNGEERALATHMIRGRSLNTAFLRGSPPGSSRVRRVWLDVQARLVQAALDHPAGLWYFTYREDVRRSRRPPAWEPPMGQRKAIHEDQKEGRNRRPYMVGAGIGSA